MGVFKSNTIPVCTTITVRPCTPAENSRLVRSGKLMVYGWLLVDPFLYQERKPNPQ